MRICKNIFLCICILGCGIKIFAEEELPFIRYYSRVKKTDINVRAMSSTSSEIMYTLKKGEDVLVTGESGDWLKIKPKEGSYAWVFHEMLENGIIIKNNVNIRVGPGLDSSILGKLSEGDPVLVAENQGEWVKIEMPRNFGFWIASYLVNYLCPEDQYQEYILKEKEVVKIFEEVEIYRKEELTKKYTDVDYNQIIDKYQYIIDNYPGFAEAKKAMERIIDTREKKVMAQQKKLTLREMRRVLNLYEEAEIMRKKLVLEDHFTPDDYNEVEKKYKHISTKYPRTKEARLSLERLDELKTLKSGKMVAWKEKHQFHETGKIKPFKNPAYPDGTHELYKGTINKKIISVLYSKNIDLRAYEKNRVEIKGTIVQDEDEYYPYPLVEVTKISLK